MNDLEAIRKQTHAAMLGTVGTCEWQYRVLALCDEIEALRADRDGWKGEYDALFESAVRDKRELGLQIEQLRAERAAMAAYAADMRDSLINHESSIQPRTDGKYKAIVGRKWKVFGNIEDARQWIVHEFDCIFPPPAPTDAPQARETK